MLASSLALDWISSVISRRVSGTGGTIDGFLVLARFLVPPRLCFDCEMPILIESSVRLSLSNDSLCLFVVSALEARAAFEAC